jgi:hypothetical protein
MDFETEGCVGHDSEDLLLIDNTVFLPDLALVWQISGPI